MQKPDAHVASTNDVGSAQADVTNAQALEALEYAANMLREQANQGGYGFYRPENPHDFFPDQESCSEAEIANHKAACDAWDRGDYKRDTSGGWVTPNMHVLTAPWGIGSYNECDKEMEGHAITLQRMADQIRIDALAA